MKDTERQKQCDTLQVWYTHNLALTSLFACIKEWLTELFRIGPSLGYHPDTGYIYLITLAENKELDMAYFWEEGLKIRTVFIYLGGFMGAYGNTTDYTKTKVDNCIKSTEIFLCFVVRKPQYEFS